MFAKELELNMRTKVKQIFLGKVGESYTVKGWVKTIRDQKKFAFLEVNDGSCMKNLQVIVDAEIKNYSEIVEKVTTGASIAATGELVESPGKGQSVELRATHVEVIGTCDAEDYPLQKKRHSFEFLRSIAHLRSRTNTIGAVARIRNALAFATHKFFQERGFLYIHTPIITGSDAEGAGQMFQVTTLDMENLPKGKEGKVDFSKDFFNHKTFLTVTGQLNVETYACGMSDVYTFGPTFRAENSNTSRHLAEFWMIEPEMAFADINDDLDCAEAYIKYLLKHLFENCEEDLQFFNKFIDKTLIERLQHVLKSDFERLSYTDAIDILQKTDKKFEFPVSWGIDLQSEHERYLTEEHFKKPVAVINYPKDIKAFYMRQNDDGKTVAAMDILVAGIGEVIGGSQREERYDRLISRIEEMGLKQEDYAWYLELGKYGAVPHAGFGLGFERMIQYATGMENIRDVIPFPRTPGKADF
jgi:asparaginyl-tRNA synthetase